MMTLPLMTLWAISLRAFSCDLSIFLNNTCLWSLRVVRSNSKKWSCCSRSRLSLFSSVSSSSSYKCLGTYTIGSSPGNTRVLSL
jgi:hypothetical protein